jgi:hypothetical protein
VVTKIGDIELKGWDEAKYKQALIAGYPGIDAQGNEEYKVRSIRYDLVAPFGATST